jgi:hypothetical protein
MPGDGPRDFEPPTPPMPKGFDALFGPRKTKVALILAGCGLVLLTVVGIGKGIGPGRYWPWSGLDIDVSEPQLKGGGPAGTFTMYHAAFTGIPSDGLGGACLIADIASKVSAGDAVTYGIKNMSCTSDDQCNPLHKGVFPSPQKWWGYCAPDPDKANRRCWYKPVLADEKQLCEKSPYYAMPTDPKFDPSNPKPKVWKVGVDNPTPHVGGYDLKTFYDTYTNGQTARWRVVGLVRGKSGDELVRYGDPATLP